MKTVIRIFLALLPLASSEMAAKWWTEPALKSAPAEVLSFQPPADANWKVKPDQYRELQHSLRCSSGWLADVTESDGPGMRVSSFSWDHTSTISTLEAFKHLPEQCMGSVGMKMEKVHPPRIFHSGNATLIFDSTLFRPERGGASVHVFKCVWVEGLDSPDLRKDALGGATGNRLRQLRLTAAATRFKPRHTRVIMGSVVGLPSEELAWQRFSRTALPHLTWEYAR
jgi:hypothetical protein